MDKPHVYFGLLLTALRNEGWNIPTSDAATATLMADALDIIEPEDNDAETAAGALSSVMHGMADEGQLALDNGSNPV